jgi:hypothetical protein
MPIKKVSIPDSIARAADNTIDIGKPMVVKAYGFIPVTEQFLRDFGKKVLTKYNRPDLAPALALLLKELTVNAAKANFKKVLFQENAINAQDPEDNERGMKLFRAAISESMAREYGKKAKAADLNVHAAFDFNDQRIIIEVRNNHAMSKIEEARVREKLEQAMECEDIAEYMMANLDETEGAGLGLVMSLMALKTAGIDPHALTISTDFEKSTVARVEIPLQPGYKIRRKRTAESQSA